MNHFYDNLKYIRLSKKMSMEKFGELINQSSANISRWENKNNGITVDIANDIANKLGYSIGDLIEKDLRFENNLYDVEAIVGSYQIDRELSDKMKDLPKEDKEMFLKMVDSIIERDKK